VDRLDFTLDRRLAVAAASVGIRTLEVEP